MVHAQYGAANHDSSTCEYINGSFLSTTLVDNEDHLVCEVQCFSHCVDIHFCRTRGGEEPYCRAEAGHTDNGLGAYEAQVGR